MTAKECARAANTSNSLVSSPETVTRYQSSQHQVLRRQVEEPKPVADELTIGVITPTISTELSPPSGQAPLLQSARIPRLRRSKGPGAIRTPTSLWRKGKVSRGPPPPSMITQGHYASPTPIKSWISQQRTNNSNTGRANHHESHDKLNPARPISSRSTYGPWLNSTCKLRSSRSTPEMSLQSSRQELACTYQTSGTDESCEETINDEGDLFLRAAHDEERARVNQSNDCQYPNAPANTHLNYASSPENVAQSPSKTRYREFYFKRNPSSSFSTRSESRGQALSYMSTKGEKLTAENVRKNSDPHEPNKKTIPCTPKGSYRDAPPSDSYSVADDQRLTTPYTLQHPFEGARHSISGASLSVRKGYRQANGKPPTPRTYNSSPLVPRAIELHSSPGQVRLREDNTESTVSTTAQSAVWDELEDLRSRIHRLELNGKLPASLGTPISRSSVERPPTATTTVTSISTSPKHYRATSRSPPPRFQEPYSGTEVNQLLKSALMKTKSTLSPEIYKALEASACDAISIALMMGSSGHQGPISKSQLSSNGFPAAVSDRQVRRKAESMLRSLTELCLALSEAEHDHNTQMSPLADGHLTQEAINSHTPLISPHSSLVKSSPRTLTRLEARRSSSLVPSPSSLMTSSQPGASARQGLLSGRRTSLFLRSSHQARTDELIENPESKLRLPSRSYSELNPARNPSRDRISQPHLPEKLSAIPSSLPRRRHHTLVNLTPKTPLSTTSLSERRRFERSMSEQDPNMNGFGHKPRNFSHDHSLGFELSNLPRRSRHPSAADYSSISRTINYNSQ